MTAFCFISFYAMKQNIEMAYGLTMSKKMDYEFLLFVNHNSLI
ncbi:hypothetical protein [Flavobacterium granuli]|uniref:Uncharacterized protein n=1 Tax=Flavobacterium granuli TaxID=280093 RepID=A0ABU1S335_9FLAO|nr:hypothetical protein [Flavobacterium granuli]MDR6845438.1 hypothetical protein [Flavobacterium granuli]